MPGRALCSAVSSRVRRNFGRKFASRGREENIQHFLYIFFCLVLLLRQKKIVNPILDIKTHYKPTETFQYTHFTSCHSPGVKKVFIKGEAITLLKTNSSKTTFEECLSNFKVRLKARGYLKSDIERSLSEVNFALRQSALKQAQKTHDEILPFDTTHHHHPAVRNLKQIVMENWSLIQN